MRAQVLGADHTRVVARGTVRGALYDLGEYPGLVASDDEDARVPGVVLVVSATALAQLDRYEGVDEGLYVRERVAVECDSDRIEAWLYRYARSIAGRRRIAAWPP